MGTNTSKNYSSSLHKSKTQFAKTLTGTLIAVLGIGFGVALVNQPQLLNQKAATVRYSPTPTPFPTGKCNPQWTTKKCGGGTCGLGERQWTRVAPAGCNIETERCMQDTTCGLPYPTTGPCSNSGQTKCEKFSNGQDTGRVVVCAGGRWRASSCGDGVCSNGKCVKILPTSTPACFLAGTKVATGNGSKNIEDLKVGEKVLSFAGDRSVSESLVSDYFATTKDYYYELVTDKSSVNVTAEHPFYNGSTYTEAKDLGPGDTLYVMENGSFSQARVISNTRIDKKVDVYNLTVDQNHTYFANGFAVHNKTVEFGGKACGKYGYGSYALQPGSPGCGANDSIIGTDVVKYCPATLTGFKKIACTTTGAYSETYAVNCCIGNAVVQMLKDTCANAKVSVNTTLLTGSTLPQDLDEIKINGIPAGIDPSRFDWNNPQGILYKATNEITYTNDLICKKTKDSHCLNDSVTGIKDINGAQITTTSPKCDFSGVGKKDGRCCK